MRARSALRMSPFMSSVEVSCTDRRAFSCSEPFSTLSCSSLARLLLLRGCILGVSTLLKDLRVKDVKVRMHVGSAAAKGIVERNGLSKWRHIGLDIL